MNTLQSLGKTLATLGILLGSLFNHQAVDNAPKLGNSYPVNGTTSTVQTLTGTPNQIIVSNPTGTVTLSAANPFTVNQTTIGSTTVVGGTATSTITGDGTASYIPNLATVLTVPSNFSTAGCAGNASNTDFGLCVNALYNSVSSTASSVIIMVPAMSVASTSWTTAINFNHLNEYPFLSCAPAGGTTLQWGGTGTTTAITYNAGDNLREGYGFDGCRFAGVNTVNASTTGLSIGGSQGAAGFVATNFQISNFGTNVEIGSNTFVASFKNGMIGNATTSDVLYDASSNAGENIQFDHVDFYGGNNGSGGVLNCVNLSTGFSSFMFINPSFDECQLATQGAGTGVVTIVSPHIEDSAVSTGGSSYQFINNSSTGGVAVNISGGLVIRDATSGVPGQMFLNSGYMNLSNMIFSLNTNATSTQRLVSNQTPIGSLTTFGLVNLGGFVNINNNIAQGNPFLTVQYTNQQVFAMNYSSSSSGIVNFNWNGIGAGSVASSGWVFAGTSASGVATVQVRAASGVSSTLMVGDSTHTSCLELGTASGTARINYVYTDSNNALLVTSTKPVFCD